LLFQAFRHDFIEDIRGNGFDLIHETLRTSWLAASVAAETFSVIIRVTSLGAAVPPAAIFITLRTITRFVSNPSSAPSVAAANQMPNISGSRFAAAGSRPKHRVR
jgi:hypothetical protein